MTTGPTPPPPSRAAASDGSRRAAERVVKNTVLRAVGDIVGKLATLLVLATLARKVGASGMGVYVFALAWAELATLPVALGIDRFILRQVARDRRSLDDLFFNILWLKVSRFVPIAAASFVLLHLLGHDSRTVATVLLLSVGALFDSIGRTLSSVFNGVERGELVASTLIAQRLCAAALGLAVLATGHGIVAVAGTYAVGTALGAAVGLTLLRLHLWMPRRHLPRAARRDARRRGLAFAVQDLFGTLLARLDTLLLTLMASDAVVGLYGASYKLLESTIFLAAAITSAFSAMFTYLGATTQPTIRAAYGRSLKLALSVLTPCATVYLVLAEPLCRLVFGDRFAAAADPLRILAPVVVLLGVVLLSTSLILGRAQPAVMRRYAGIALAVNLAANLVLIPPFGAEGAATAMLISEVVFAVILVRRASADVGAPAWPATLGAPLIASAAMALPMWLLSGTLPLALLAGAITYTLVFLAAERRIAPVDLQFLQDLVRHRLPARG